MPEGLDVLTLLEDALQSGGVDMRRAVTAVCEKLYPSVDGATVS
jgi:hypothetical protein